MKITSKQAVAFLGGLFSLGTFARVSVLLLESIAIVRDERNRDIDLLELCRSGAARESAKMRVACLHAQSERASPILLKAVLHAFSTAFQDFSESVSSPSKLMLVLLFAVTSVFLPMSSIIRALMPVECPEAQSHVVVVANDSYSPRGAGARFRRAFGSLRLRPRKSRSFGQATNFENAIIDMDSANNDGMVEVELGDGRHKIE